MKKPADRIATLEAKIARLERELARMSVRPARPRIPRLGIWLGKTDASHAKGASGTVSIFGGTPLSEVDTTKNVTAYNKFANLASGKWCVVVYIQRAFYLIAGEC